MPKSNENLRAYTRDTKKNVVSISVNIKKRELIINETQVEITAGQSEILWQSKTALLSIQFLEATPFLAKSFICAPATGCLSGIPKKAGTYRCRIEAKYIDATQDRTQLLTVELKPIEMTVIVKSGG